MKELDYKNIIKIKRTFLLICVLVVVTCCVMYLSTERLSHYSNILKDHVAKFRRNVYRAFRNTSLVHKSILRSGENATRDLNSSSINLYRDVNFVKNSSNLTIVKTLVDKLNGNPVNNINVKPETKSKEFPGMPDPCAKPRRQTGVEDILCMKRPDFLPEYKNPCWMDGGQFVCLPYFHLIGICKSGTSDFFKRLLLHPDILPNKGIFGKEIWYWSWRRFAIKNRAGKMKLGMTLQEFTRQFDAARLRTSVDSQGHHTKITGHGDPMDIWDRFREEATPQNTPGAEELLWTTPYAVRHINPNVKLLLMLRDPIERLYSHYFHSGAGTSAQSFHNHVTISIDLWKKCVQKHSVRHCIYSAKFKNTLKAPIYTSFYVVHLKEWLKVFPREKLFIFRNEDYSSDIKGTMKQIFNFLDVPVPSETVLNKMKSLPHFYETKSKKRAGPMLPETKAMLVDLYRPYTEELATFLKDERFSFKDRSFKV